MQLNLKPNDNFNERLNQMKVLIAESGKNGKLKYIEDDKLAKVSLLFKVAYFRREKLIYLL